MSPFNPALYDSEDEIDRAYHPIPKDDAWKKVTIQHIIDRDRRLILGCCGCQREQMVWPRLFADKYKIPVDTPLLTVERRIRCTTCGQRIIHLWPEPYSIEHDRLGRPRA